MVELTLARWMLLYFRPRAARRLWLPEWTGRLSLSVRSGGQFCQRRCRGRLMFISTLLAHGNPAASTLGSCSAEFAGIPVGSAL